jgi:hypothetical protein
MPETKQNAAAHAAAPAAPTAPPKIDPFNRRLYMGRLRTERGPIYLIHITYEATGEEDIVRWDRASPELKEAARRWAIDPLRLLEEAEAPRHFGGGSPPPAAPLPGVALQPPHHINESSPRAA